MSKSEMVERTRKAMKAFEQLPPEEQFRQLVAWGVIDNEGEVLFGPNKTREGHHEANLTKPTPSPGSSTAGRFEL